MRILPSLLTIAAALSTAGVAVAQDPRAPAAVAITKSAGFEPEVIMTDVVSGGAVDTAGRLRSDCVGRISGPPNVSFTYRAGSAPLFMSIRSQGDTTLIVHNPNGNWGCSDDYNGVNPALRWDAPESGTYLIWVGAIGASAPAVLSITEKE